MKYTQVIGVIALLTAPAQATKLDVHAQHRHRLEAHKRAPVSEDFIGLELDAKERESQFAFSGSAANTKSRGRGILDKVQAKIEQDERDEAQIALAKQAKKAEEDAMKEAEIIERQKILNKQMK